MAIPNLVSVREFRAKFRAVLWCWHSPTPAPQRCWHPTTPAPQRCWHPTTPAPQRCWHPPRSPGWLKLLAMLRATCTVHGTSDCRLLRVASHSYGQPSLASASRFVQQGAASYYRSGADRHCWLWASAAWLKIYHRLAVALDFGVILKLCLNHFGVTLDSFWSNLGVTLGSLWGHFGVTLGSF